LQVEDKKKRFGDGGRYEDDGSWRCLWGEKIELAVLDLMVLFWSEGEIGRASYSQKPTFRRRGEGCFSLVIVCVEPEAGWPLVVGSVNGVVVGIREWNRVVRLLSWW